MKKSDNNLVIDLKPFCYRCAERKLKIVKEDGAEHIRCGFGDLCDNAINLYNNMAKTRGDDNANR